MQLIKIVPITTLILIILSNTLFANNYFYPQQVDEKPYILVSLLSESCKYCIASIPTLEKLKNNYNHSVSFEFYDINKTRNILQTFPITKTPAYFLLDKNRNILTSTEGYRDYSEFENLFSQLNLNPKQ